MKPVRNLNFSTVAFNWLSSESGGCLYVPQGVLGEAVETKLQAEQHFVDNLECHLKFCFKKLCPLVLKKN